MSRFEELCRAYAADREEMEADRHACVDFAGRVATTFAERIGLPQAYPVPIFGVGPKTERRYLEFVPLDEEPQEGATYSVFGATHLGQDRCWHTGVSVAVERAPSAYPKLRVRLDLHTRRDRGGAFTVKLRPEDDGVTLHGEDPDGLSRVHEYLFEALIGHLDQSYRRFMDGAAIRPDPGTLN